MIEHVWSVLCTRASIDKETNNISLFDVIEQIAIVDWTGQPGTAAAEFELVSLWTRDELNRPERAEARVSVRNPSGRRSVEQIQEIDLRQFRRLRARSAFKGLPIEGPGLYIFIVEMRVPGQEQWIPVAKVPLDVTTTADSGPVSPPQR
jgi:hypothetical protein